MFRHVWNFYDVIWYKKMMKYSIRWWNTLKFEQMAERMFGNKVIPWIASSKSSDQKVLTFVQSDRLFKNESCSQQTYFLTLDKIGFVKWYPFFDSLLEIILYLHKYQIHIMVAWHLWIPIGSAKMNLAARKPTFRFLIILVFGNNVCIFCKSKNWIIFSLIIKTAWKNVVSEKIKLTKNERKMFQWSVYECLYSRGSSY